MNNLIRDLIKAIDERNFEECIRICDTLISKDPSNHIIYEARGICKQRLLRINEAGGDFVKAAELNPASLEDIKYELEKLIDVEEDLKFDESPETKDINSIVPPELKSLHDDIEQKIKPPVSETREYEPKPEVKYEPIFPDEEKTGFFRSPLFFIFSALSFLVLFVFLVYWFILRQPEKNLAENIKPVDTTLNDQSNDTAVKQVPKDTGVSEISETKEPSEETDKQKQPEKTETSGEPQKETEQTPDGQKERTYRTVGFFGSGNQFMLVEEQGGFYVQVGSFQDREKADKKLKFLESTGIKAEISTANIEGKGTFYRVRAGSFESVDKAKSIEGKLK